MKKLFISISTILVLILFTGCPLPTDDLNVELTPSTIIFADGDTESKQLGSGNYTNTVSGDGEGAITYTSGTPSTATVDASTGEVTLLAVGTTVVTAVKAAAGTYATITNTYTLTVSALTPSTIVFADGATVSKLIGSENYTNTVSGDGTGTITYTSGTPATATVDSISGEVTIESVGTTVITAVKEAIGIYDTVTSTYTFVVVVPLYSDMVTVTGGTFAQSDTFNQTISDFSIGKYEVTYELWHSVYTWAIDNEYSFANAGIEGNDGTAGADPTSAKYEPVTTINWRDSIVWCNAYSEMVGRTPVYENTSGVIIKDSTDSNATDCDATVPDGLANGYRLPTEGEWQFAASNRKDFDTSYTYSGSDTVDDVAWYYDNSISKTHDVGGKQANELGLYDMAGNVWEWCFDWYSSSYPSDTTDYTGVSSGSYRVIRGGSWNYSSSYCTVSYRSNYSYPYYESGSGGFRLAHD